MTLGQLGLGLRWEFADELLARAPESVDFLELSPENYIGRGGSARRTLERALERYPVVTHGLTMSLGGVEPLDDAYLAELRAFIAAVGSPWHSDHACMTAHGGRVLHELLPLPLTRAHAALVAERVKRARDAIGVPLCVENVSAYVRLGQGELTEPEFMLAVCEQADCDLLFDVNNAIVNATNFGHDVRVWLDDRILARVRQVHVAGHEWFDFADGELLNRGDTRPEAAPPLTHERLVVDTHGAAVQPATLDFLGEVLRRVGPVPVVLERDENVPPLAALLAEVERLRAVVALSASARIAPPRSAG
ncbi:MAG: DUF692 domain-containing protein [Myxococcales bacterium]|nr:DUF692 domain-containing protein [Myxococcales bacterium]